MRIVSLVPSLTEALIDFGLAGDVVGRTRYCEEPADIVAGIETVGGTKNPDVARILEIRPDLVIVNKEENRLEDCRALEKGGLRLHVTHPQTVIGAAQMLEDLGAICGAARQGASLARRCRQAISAQASAASGRVPTFCPIWRKPYMTFRDATYVGDVLASCGCDNIFGSRRSADFFEVTIEEIVAAGPELVVLPDEPYAFEARHEQELREAGIQARYLFIDGKDLTWYGPRIPLALERLSKAVRETLASPAPGRGKPRARRTT